MDFLSFRLCIRFLSSLKDVAELITFSPLTATHLPVCSALNSIANGTIANMGISLHISPRIIPSIASLYNDTNRIFMEYIDNSIDSAEEFFEVGTNTYKKDIFIILTIKDDSVVVKDNCFGITNFTKVVQEVGNSDKKAQPWTNGQFGYGIYSFMAACGKLEIISKLQKEKTAQIIVIERRKFDTDHQEDVNFCDPKSTNYSHSSGTKVVLSEFDKNMWKQIDFEEIKQEIEKHFELLLARKNLQIKLVDERTSEEHICEPFNYAQYEGEIYSDNLDKLYYTKGRKEPKKIGLIVQKPIYVFLKVVKGKTINKLPVFIAKGRRIAEIKDVKQFRSKHKSDIWGHPNMTGYIDLSDYLEPTIARNDFKNNDKSKALFNTLEELEPLILEVIRDVNRETEEQHYQVLEDKLNQALSKLAKMDAMNYRTEYLSGNDINLQKGGSGQSFEEGHGKKDRGHKKGGGGENGWGGENEGDGSGPSGKTGSDTSGGEDEGDFASSKEADNPFEDTGFKGGKKKKSGFDIKFVNGEIVDAETNKPVRSQLIGGTIRIFREHPDFQERVDYSRTKEPKISQRLITYLAGEITVHYKDKLQTRHGQPEYNKRLFENLVEFIYQFESLVKDLAGQNLSDFSE